MKRTKKRVKREKRVKRVKKKRVKSNVLIFLGEMKMENNIDLQTFLYYII